MTTPQIGDVVKNITDDVKTIVTGEIALAKAELTETGKKVGGGAGMFGGAGYLGLNGLSLLFMAGGFGIGELFNWLLDWSFLGSMAIGFVIMALILLAIAAILAMIGKGKLKGLKGPERTVAEGKAAAEDVKLAIERGKENVEAEAKQRELAKEADKQARHDEVVVAARAWTPGATEAKKTETVTTTTTTSAAPARAYGETTSAPGAGAHAAK